MFLHLLSLLLLFMISCWDCKWTMHSAVALQPKTYILSIYVRHLKININMLEIRKRRRKDHRCHYTSAQSILL